MLIYTLVEEYSSEETGHWRVVISSPDPTMTPGFWYIRNIWTGKKKKIGPVGAPKANYADQAHKEAARRNAKIRQERRRKGV